MKAICLTLVLVAIGGYGCSAKRDDPYQTRRSSFFSAIFSSDPYEDVFWQYTQKDETYADFEPVIHAHTTYWSPELRQAYIDESVRQFRLGQEETRRLIQSQQAIDQKYLVFVISASTKEWMWNRLERVDGLWRITLENQAGDLRLDPEQVEVVAHKDEQARHFYKAMTTFNRTYRVTFLKRPFRDVKKATLFVTGPKGVLEFDVDLETEDIALTNPLQRGVERKEPPIEETIEEQAEVEGEAKKEK